MEKTSLAAVLPIDSVWSDLGSWDAVRAVSLADGLGNAALGDVTLLDTQDCLIRADPGRRVVAVGLRNLAIVVKGNDILVSDLGASDRLKLAVDGLES